MTDNTQNTFMRRLLFIALASICIVSAIEISMLSRQYQYKTAEWIKVGENISGQVSYEKQSVARTISNEIIVLTKHTYSFEAHKVIAAVLPKIAGFLYVMALDRIDCGEQTYTSLRMVYKTVEGKTLYDTMEGWGRYRRLGYRPIPPDSLIGQVANAVCAGYSI